MAETDSGSGAVSLFPVSNKLQARMNLLKEAIENQKSDIRRIRGEMRGLIEKKENEIIKELDSIWDEGNARIDRKKEEVQKKIEEIETDNKEMKKNYDKMTKLLRELNQTVPPLTLPVIYKAIESARSQLDVSIPYLNLSWGVDELRESINRMCRVEQVFREDAAPFCSTLERSVEKEKTVTDQAEIEVNEPNRKEERERRFEMELSEWKNRHRILEQSMKTADNENEILKKEVNQLKSKLLEARTKQANAQEVEELKLSLVQAKKEIEVLRAETKEKMQQSEQLEQERRKQDLEKLKEAQKEFESYKRAASRYRDQAEIGTNEASRKEEKERRLEMELDEWKSRNRILEQSMKKANNENEILKREVDQLTRTKQTNAQEVEELKLSLVQVKKEMEVLRTETKRRLQQSEQLEQEKRKQDLENLKQGQTEGEIYRRPASTTKGIRPNTWFICEESLLKYSDTMRDFPQSKDDQFTPQKPRTSSLSNPSISEEVDTAKSKKSFLAQNPFLLQDGAQNKIVGEKRNALTRVGSQVSRQRSNMLRDEIERYNPDVRTVFLNKTCSLLHNSSYIKTTNLSHLKNPDSHISKQVLVKIKGQLRLGNLKVVFSKMHVYFKKTEMMAGILLQEPVGISNGVFDYIRHFDCPDNHAVFVLISLRSSYLEIFFG